MYIYIYTYIYIHTYTGSVSVCKLGDAANRCRLQLPVSTMMLGVI